MRIVIATPLYPPDIGAPAPYTKELAERLSDNHMVTVVTYGALPEALKRVSVMTVSKRTPLPIRLSFYTFALLRAARSADVLYIENGPSVELPAVIVSLLLRRPLILHIGDRAAHARAAAGGLSSFVERLASRRARAVLETSPHERPEILPLQARPVAALADYEASWKTHLSSIEHALLHD